ncbi:hypothetical protein ACKI2N_007925 [Cupriavidus sp. 30B13]
MTPFVRSLAFVRGVAPRRRGALLAASWLALGALNCAMATAMAVWSVR